MSGILDRELKIFEDLIKRYNLKFTFITYGDESDLNYDLNKNITVLPIYSIRKRSTNKLANFIRSFNLSKKLLSEINDFDLIKQNQLLGSWVAIMFKLHSGKALYVRTGYDMFLFSIKDKKSFFKKFLYFCLTQISLFFSNIYSVTSKSDHELLGKYFLGTKKLVIRSNWVEQNKSFNFEKRNSSKILTVGRLEEQKDYPHLIKSLQNTGLELDIIGEGTKKKELEDLAKELSVKVNFLGVIRNSELIDIYGGYKYFISTSSFEGNPKVILEAMSSGCVVLANDIPNNVEIISHLKNGILFSKKNDDLRKLVLSLPALDNEKNISTEAINYIKEFNSLEKASLEFYDDFISLTTSN
tara:strand:- start:628 stop:1695 length:1068 start_codon:yes stop_codon:yes gene_type:complete